MKAQQETSDMQCQESNDNTNKPNTSKSTADDVQEIDNVDSAIVAMPLNKSQEEILQQESRDSQKPICRICFGGESTEKFISPCMCKGSIGFVHRNCLEHWLGSTNNERCELCNHEFTIFRTRKKIGDWCSDPSTVTDRKNVCGDVLCFLFLTPLGMISFYLCIKGAYYFYAYEKAVLEATSLVGLAAFLIFAYCTWVTLAIKYHYSAWLAWRMRNWNIQVIVPSNIHINIQIQNNRSSEEQDEELNVNVRMPVNNKSTPVLPSSVHSSHAEIQIDSRAIQRDSRGIQREVSFKEDDLEQSHQQPRISVSGRAQMATPEDFYI